MPDNKFRLGEFLAALAGGIGNGSFNPGPAIGYAVSPRGREMSNLAREAQLAELGASTAEARERQLTAPSQGRAQRATFDFVPQHIAAQQDVLPSKSRAEISGNELQILQDAHQQQLLQEAAQAFANYPGGEGAFKANAAMEGFQASQAGTQAQTEHTRQSTDVLREQLAQSKERQPITIGGVSYNLAPEQSAQFAFNKERFASLDELQKKQLASQLAQAGATVDFANTPEYINYGLRTLGLPEIPQKVDPTQERLKIIDDVMKNRGGGQKTPGARPTTQSANEGKGKLSATTGKPSVGFFDKANSVGLGILNVVDPTLVKNFGKVKQIYDKAEGYLFPTRPSAKNEGMVAPVSPAAPPPTPAAAPAHPLEGITPEGLLQGDPQMLNQLLEEAERRGISPKIDNSLDWVNLFNQLLMRAQ